MTALISTEWRKLLTTRGPLAALAGLLVLSVAVAVGGMGDIGSGTATETEDARELLVVGSGLFASLVLLVLGTLAATGEFQHRTAVTTYLITPRRGRVLAAKLIAHAIVGALVSAVLVAVTFPIVLSWRTARTCTSQARRASSARRPPSSPPAPCRPSWASRPARSCATRRRRCSWCCSGCSWPSASCSRRCRRCSPSEACWAASGSPATRARARSRASPSRSPGREASSPLARWRFIGRDVA